MFTRISSVTASFTLEGGIDGGGQVADLREETFAEGGVSGLYREQPTISITPLQGREFAMQFITNLSLDRLTLLLTAGWELEHLLNVAVSKFGRLTNPLGRPAMQGDPLTREYFRLTRLLGEAQRRGDIDFMGFAATESGGSIARLAFFLTAAEADLVSELLDLPTPPEKLQDGRFRTIFNLREGPGEDEIVSLGEKGYLVTVTARNFMDIIRIYSYGVEVPSEDEQTGRAVAANRALSETTCGLSIRYSWLRPENAAVLTRHRGGWRWIDDADLDSKRAFQFLRLLQALQSGDEPGVQPVLTLPVQ